MPDDRDTIIREAVQAIIEQLVPMLREELRKIVSPTTGPASDKLIFINYRRNDSEDVCGRIYDRLVVAFGKDSVFRDVVNILPGHDFRLALEQQVAACDVMLVLMGQDWLSVENHARLQADDDYVRFEIETALKRNIPVIPVFVTHRTAMPDNEQLPPSLRELVYRQAIPVRADPDFHADVDRLVARIRDIFELLDEISSEST